MLLETKCWLEYIRLLPYGIRAHDLPLGRGTLRYYTAGCGSDMLMITGARGRALDDIGLVLPGLIQNYHILAPDLPGFGHSQQVFDPDKISIPAIAAILHQFLDRLHLREPLVLAAASLGGWIALHMVVQRPERFRRIVLACPAGLSGEHPVDNIKAAIAPETVEQLAHGLRLLSRQRTWLPRFLLRDMLATFRSHNHILHAVVREDDLLDEAQLHAIDTPTMIYWGADDRIVPVTQGLRMAAAMPHAHLVILPHCGHAINLDYRKQCLTLIRQGLEEPRVAIEASPLIYAK